MSAHVPDHRLERLVFFSDAVFAIAITLLVIDLRAPRLPPGAPDIDYWQALATILPEILSFLISFMVIGFFWAGHHRAFSCAAHWSDRLVAPNLFLLMAIAAMPFVTAFASANPGQRVPVLCYTGWMVLLAVLNMIMQRLALSPPVVGRADARQVAIIRDRGLAVLLGAVTAFAVSLVAPLYGQAALVSMPLFRRALGAFRKG